VGNCWRVVEAQIKISTAKLTDNASEQHTLELLIEQTKPVMAFSTPPTTRIQPLQNFAFIDSCFSANRLQRSGLQMRASTLRSP
jgi:hypothetical protein